jgi:hypothetical protein
MVLRALLALFSQRTALACRMTLYRAMAGDTSEATCAALTPVLKAVADGAIGFERRRRVWELVEHYRPAHERDR